MITVAKQEMIAGLKEILKKSFGDPDDYINFYVSNRLKFENTYVYNVDAKPVSMLTLMPANIYINGCHEPVTYVYGVSTLPEYRGRGLSTGLLEHVNELVLKDGVTSFLCPASEGLFKFYERQNYKTSFYIREASLSINQLLGSDVSFNCLEATPEEYKAVRDERFQREGYIDWGIDAIEYAIRENMFWGGKALIVESCHGRDIILYRVFNKKLFVVESSINDKDLLYALLRGLMGDGNIQNTHIRLHPESEIASGSIRGFAMIYNSTFNFNRGYFNLALD